jgi:tetratricopeptide (TPR) repeat protein
MKQLILISAIFVLSYCVSAQQIVKNDESESEQTYFSISGSIYEGAVEPNVSETARELNNKGVKKALTEHNYEAATELFRQAVDSDARCFVCQYNLGMSLIKTEKYDEPLKIFARLVAVKPDDSNAYAGLGESYYKKGLYRESLDAYQKAVKLVPTDAVMFANLGTVLYQAGDYKKALINFDKALELSPDLIAAHNNKGTALYAMGRHKEAVKSLQTALALQPDSAEAHNNLGVALSSIGREKEAHQYYLEALRLRPKWELALYNLARNYLDLGNRRSAQEQLSVLENVSPALAQDLKKIIFGKYLLNAAETK